MKLAAGFLGALYLLAGVSEAKSVGGLNAKSPSTGSKPGFQHYATWFDQRCAKSGANPFQILGMWSDKCAATPGCLPLRESDTSLQGFCSKGLYTTPDLKHDDTYMVLHFYLKSGKCEGPVHEQAVNMKQDDSCAPTNLQETPTSWVKTMCDPEGQGAGLALCPDDECAECEDPMLLASDVCYSSQPEGDDPEGDDPEGDVFSLKVSCIKLSRGRLVPGRPARAKHVRPLPALLQAVSRDTFSQLKPLKH